LDQPAAGLANALVGNAASAAVLETTLMGCALRFSAPARVAVTGATAVVQVDGLVVTGVVEVPAGSVLDIGRATAGLRSYVAVAGGIGVEPVLGSRSTDTLSGLGPPRLTDGMTLPIGSDLGSSPAAAPLVATGEITLGVWFGPRDDWFADAAELCTGSYTVSPVSNRVGARLAGRGLTRAKAGELPSEGVVLGAIQVPADGQPLIFLADHPTTGGYPVIGVVDDVTPLAQARPGTTVRFQKLDSVFD
jgi:biotin-dependent carboxylase-like uncharacterized protein